MKLRGFFLFHHILAITVCVVVLSGGAYAGSRIIDNVRAEKIVRECEAIDFALVMYSDAHTNVLPDTVAVKENVNGSQYLAYKKGRVYPQNLTDLGIVRDEQGWFSKTIDLSKYDYSVNIAADGSITYQLGVHMPNGYYYTSPRSGK